MGIFAISLLIYYSIFLVILILQDVVIIIFRGYGIPRFRFLFEGCSALIAHLACWLDAAIIKQEPGFIIICVCHCVLHVTSRLEECWVFFQQETILIVVIYVIGVISIVVVICICVVDQLRSCVAHYHIVSHLEHDLFPRFDVFATFVAARGIRGD